MAPMRCLSSKRVKLDCGIVDRPATANQRLYYSVALEVDCSSSSLSLISILIQAIQTIETVGRRRLPFDPYGRIYSIATAETSTNFFSNTALTLSESVHVLMPVSILVFAVLAKVCVCAST